MNQTPPARDALRYLLDTVLRTDDDLLAFASDHFPTVRRGYFTAGLSRVAWTTALLDHAPHEHILGGLMAKEPGQTQALLAELAANTKAVPPTPLLGFIIKGQLGSGGLGTVFEAWDRVRARSVAVKVLHRRHMQTPELIRRFREAAARNVALDHPHIVRIEVAEIVDERVAGLRRPAGGCPRPARWQQIQRHGPRSRSAAGWLAQAPVAPGTSPLWEGLVARRTVRSGPRPGAALRRKAPCLTLGSKTPSKTQERAARRAQGRAPRPSPRASPQAPPPGGRHRWRGPTRRATPDLLT